MISGDYDVGKCLVNLFSVECKSNNHDTGLNFEG